jgi:solute carrier family 26 (sodium-independent sulfate anion transporter), member 11
MASERGPETSRVKRVISKLPVIGQRQADEAQRTAQDEWFSSLNDEAYLEKEPTVAGYFKSIAPSRLDVLYYISDTFPCSKWLFSYNLQWFLGDLVAGVTVGAVVIPQVSNSELLS